MPTNVKQTTRKVTYSFNSEYFSGLDLNIYFNDYLVDDIINIQYQLSETVTPLYDYASYRYKTVVRGNRLIQGSFSINFKSSFYMREVLLKVLGYSTEDTKSTQDVETVINIQSPVNLPNQLTTTDVSNILRNSTTNKVSARTITEIAKAYRESFWQQAKVPELTGTNTPYFVGNNIIRNTNTFTMYLKYKKKVFDYSDFPEITKDIEGYIDAQTPYTLEGITGVQIQSVGKAIDDSGKNIIEVYSFIGRDLIQGTE